MNIALATIKEMVRELARRPTWGGAGIGVGCGPAGDSGITPASPLLRSDGR
jgi:hypothetical protein